MLFTFYNVARLAVSNQTKLTPNHISAWPAKRTYNEDHKHRDKCFSGNYNKIVMCNVSDMILFFISHSIYILYTWRICICNVYIYIYIYIYIYTLSTGRSRCDIYLPS